MLENKTAIVTGATNGIGQAIATTLANQGCKIMFNGFGVAEKIDDLRRRLSEKYNVDVVYENCDLTDPHQILTMIASAVQRFGRIDILVNNAGIQYVSPIDEFPPDKYEAIIATNLSAPFYTIREVLPIMKRHGWGIVNISSVNGYVASIHKDPYMAAKHGLLGLTKVVALETAEIDITCNAICPGFVKTAIIDRQIKARAGKKGMSNEEAEFEHLVEKHPSKQFVPAECILQALSSISVRRKRNISRASVCQSTEAG